MGAPEIGAPAAQRGGRLVGRQTKVHLYALCTVFVWASGFALTKVALAGFSANAIGLLRYAVASLVLLPLMAVKKVKPPARRDMPWFLLAGAMGFFLYMIAFNKGLETLSSATSSLLIAAAPILTALLARFLLKEGIRPLGWLSSFVSFGGVFLLFFWGGRLAVGPGMVWTLLAAGLISGYNLLQRKLTRRYPPLQATAYSIFSGALLLLVFLPETVSQLSAAPTGPLLAAVFMGVFPSAVGYVCWSKALSLAENTGTVTNYMFLTPFLATLLGFLLIGEVPHWSTLLGGAVILGGLLLFHGAGRTDSPRQ